MCIQLVCPSVIHSSYTNCMSLPINPIIKSMCIISFISTCMQCAPLLCLCAICLIVMSISYLLCFSIFYSYVCLFYFLHECPHPSRMSVYFWFVYILLLCFNPASMSISCWHVYILLVCLCSTDMSMF